MTSTSGLASASSSSVLPNNNNQNLKPVTSIHQVLYQQQSPTHAQEFHRVNPQEFDMIKVGKNYFAQFIQLINF